MTQAFAALKARFNGAAFRFYIPGAAAEPLALAEALRADPELGRGATFIGAWIPGINDTDWSQLGDGGETVFAGSGWETSLASGRMRVLPLAYSQTWRWLATTPLDAGLIQIAPPDAAGRCSLSLTADFAGAVAARPVPLIGLINPRLPPVAQGPSLPISRFDSVVEADCPIPTYDPGGADPLSQAVADRAAALIPDGATLQTGVGKLGVAILSALGNHRNLNIHSGMATDGLIGLIESGAVADAANVVTLGAVMGSSESLGLRLAEDHRLRMAPVTVTHGLDILSRIPRFTAVNSALEVDLFGQANAEQAGRRLISGVGGLGDFLRGAQAAPDGLPILALPSQTSGGKASRIVPRLSAPLVTVGRTEVGVVVTEHGSADLRHLGLEARAEALIAIAAPEHRSNLAAAWRDLRRGA